MTDAPQELSPESELSIAVGFWLGRHPSIDAARHRLALAVQAMDGVTLPGPVQALRSAALARVQGAGNDDTLRQALAAYCADHTARNPSAHRRDRPVTPTLKPVRNTPVAASFTARSAAAMDRHGHR
jgi:hypothetical protein